MLGLLLFFATAECTTLPHIAADECGNGVVESSEDCDTYPPGPSYVCRPPGTTGACHLDCRRQSNGSHPPCPDGWACDGEGICRVPTADFDGPSDAVGVGAWSLLAGDFDGDGRTDLLTRDRLDSIGGAKLRFQYFDEKGSIADSRTFPKSLVSPRIADVSGDGRSDVVITDARVGTLLGRADRSWVPETFASYRITGAAVRLLAVFDGPIQDTAGFLALTTQKGIPGFYIPDFSNRGTLRNFATLPAPFEDLAGDPVTGTVLEDRLASPCRQTVYAFRGATSFTMLDICAQDPQTGTVLWRDPATAQLVELVPEKPIDAAPQLADINGDGHLDVLLRAGGTPYVSYGDGLRLSVASPFPLPHADTGVTDTTMPLAAADFTGDGVVDYVFPSYALVSLAGVPGSPPTYAPLRTRLSPWTVAKIADLNGNGKPDVVAASDTTLDIDFFSGNGTERPTVFSVPTSGPVQKLDVGDFDGDSINDLVYLETAASAKDRDSLKIAFGALVRPPLGAVPVAQLSGVEQLGVYTEGLTGNIAMVAKETVAGAVTSALTLVGGGGDRIPFAPYELTTFASDGSVQSSQAIALAVGAFIGERKDDVVTLACEYQFRYPLQFWLMPALDSPERRPVRFGDVLDDRLRPFESNSFDVRMGVTSAAADLDNDGRDEAIFAMPADAGGQHCAVLRVAIAPGPPPTLLSRGQMMLAQPCQDPEILPVDADADGWLDLALLTGTLGSSDRSLVVLWNDGHGGFSETDVTTVGQPDQPLRAFTALAPTPARPFSFAYVTDQAAMLTSGDKRRFGEPRMLSPLPNASGIVAADVNGDGAMDLALAASGNLSILLARLKAP